MIDDDKKAAKEARRLRKLFIEVFNNDEAKEALGILENLFETHLPSMPSVDFEPTRAAYKDGQKSVLVEIRDIIAGKYEPAENQTYEENE